MIEKHTPVTEAESELLNLISEEAAEVIQIVSKTHRFGWDSYNPFDRNKETNRARLESEIGDILTLIDIAVQRKLIDVANIGKAIESKKERLKIYSNLYED